MANRRWRDVEEWFRWKLSENQFIESHWIIEAVCKMTGRLDNESLEELFATDLEEDGYFNPPLMTNQEMKQKLDTLTVSQLKACILTILEVLYWDGDREGFDPSMEWGNADMLNSIAGTLVDFGLRPRDPKE